MNKWMDIVDDHESIWSVPLNETGYPEEIAEYWDRLGKAENMESIVEDMERNGSI